MAVPMIIATTVRPSVTESPLRIESAVNQCATIDHPKFSFRATIQAKFAARMSTIAHRSQRPHSTG